jgi:major membrane immunogen (membrane-anchored lipoprotein)
MTATKNLFENKLLQQFLEVESQDLKINEIIEDYTQLRIKSCLLNSDFARQIKTDNAHIFFKVLREQVIDELGLSKPPQITDVAFN